MDASHSPEKMHHVVAATPRDLFGSFLKGCKWSPDGSCLLTASDDNNLTLFNLPDELCHSSADAGPAIELAPALTIREGETIYDYDWYPFMSSLDCASCCIVSTSRDHPVHMWDAFSGDLRCSYRAFDHLDEISAATSLAFSANGAKIFTGFKDHIRIFRTDRPGRECETISVKAKEGGQGGIVSCFAFVPVMDGLFACGSYAGTVGLYDGATSCQWASFPVGTGVTQLAFSTDGISLFCGCRKSSEITIWDVRNVSEPVAYLSRACTTNQRIGFDLDSHRLFTGSSDGEVLTYNINGPGIVGKQSPTSKFLAHGDAVNGASVHPELPLLATSSGQRRFDEDNGDSGENMVQIITTY